MRRFTWLLLVASCSSGSAVVASAEPVPDAGGQDPVVETSPLIDASSTDATSEAAPVTPFPTTTATSTSTYVPPPPPPPPPPEDSGADAATPPVDSGAPDAGNTCVDWVDVPSSPLWTARAEYTISESGNTTSSKSVPYPCGGAATGTGCRGQMITMGATMQPNGEYRLKPVPGACHIVVPSKCAENCTNGQTEW